MKAILLGTGPFGDAITASGLRVDEVTIWKYRQGADAVIAAGNYDPERLRQASLEGLQTFTYHPKGGPMTTLDDLGGGSDPEKQEPERRPCPDCGKAVTWTQANKPRSHKCEPRQTTTAAAEEPRQEGGPVKITADQVIEAYVKTRDEIAALKKQFDEAKAGLEELQTKRANWLKGKMDELGVDSLKGQHGTVFTDWKDSCAVADWQVFFDWVMANESFEFLEHRVSKTAVKQQLDNGEPPPPGVNYTKVKDVKVRRA